MKNGKELKTADALRKSRYLGTLLQKKISTIL